MKVRGSHFAVPALAVTIDRDTGTFAIQRALDVQ